MDVREREELRKMLDEFKRELMKPQGPKCCGETLPVVRETISQHLPGNGKRVVCHNAPVWHCEKCGEYHTSLTLRVLVEAYCQATGLSEIDFDDIQKEIEKIA